MIPYIIQSATNDVLFICIRTKVQCLGLPLPKDIFATSITSRLGDLISPRLYVTFQKDSLSNFFPITFLIQIGE